MSESTPCEPRCWGAIIRQVACALVVSSTMLHVGLVMGWPAVLPELQADNTTAFNLTDNDVKWLVSSTGLAGMAGNLCAGTLMETLGPRRLLTVLLLPATVFWLLQAFTPSLAMIYVGRLGGSMLASIITTITCPLLAELLEPDYRGLLCSLPELMVSAGLLLGYLQAHQLSWQVATAVSAVPLLPLCLLTLAVPESPFWLVRRGRIQEAERSLRKIRGSTRYRQKDELPQIRRSIQEHPQTTVKDQVKQLWAAHHLKPVGLLVAVFTLRELGGQYAVFSYTIYLFQYAGLHLDAFTCTILVGVARLVATGVSAIFLDRIGRRPLLITTSVGCAVSAAIGGVFLLVDIQGSSWILLAAVLVFVLSYGLGVGPIPWVLLGELLPTPVRSIGASITTFFFALMLFLVGFVFPELARLAGTGGSLLVFAAFNSIMAAVVWIFLPETGGCSLHQLQGMFSITPPVRPLLDVTTITDSQEETPSLDQPS
ncbi:facilitated trehalose transporter Tret1-like [Homarus americanus]|nr:facilitated trehalose transporter Tret1-like [Homarus americanus]XP_042223411.1 facilitated trehalose transporter Tret1-like [Homarus americanus]XP_042223412.1 facilitated trehalose transporter Tret1-like [Homarus americanus]